MSFSTLAITGSAHASELTPIVREGLSVKLANVAGNAYYTIEKDGYRVVTTLASSEEATPVRFIATLLSGQKVIVSIPRAFGQSAVELEIKRIEDRVFVSDDISLAAWISDQAFGGRRAMMHRPLPPSTMSHGRNHAQSRAYIGGAPHARSS